jgi:iron only hydrogenase large subunit-like protein
VAGGVAQAVADLAREQNPGLEIKTARAEGLRECKKLMAMAKAGKYKGYLLEGMACPGGCVAGAGTLLPVDLATKVVGRYQSEADQDSPLESPYRDVGHELD